MMQSIAVDDVRQTTEFVEMNAQTRHVIERIDKCNSLAETTRRVLERERHVPLSASWHKARRGLLTASDMAACLGENRYCSRKELFRRKTQGKKFSGNAATRWGQDHELEAAKVYSTVTGLLLVDEPIGLIVHDYESEGQKRYAATPDFLTFSGIIVEIKCPFYRTITHAIPAHYMAQVQFQLEVTNADLAHFVQYKPPSGRDTLDGVLDILPVRRDRSWWKNSLPVFDAFCDSVQAFVPAPKKQTQVFTIPKVEAEPRHAAFAIVTLK